MEAAITLFNQIVKMFIMIAVGYVLGRKKVVVEDTTARLSNILLMVATPCTLITSFNQPYSDEKLRGLLISFGLSAFVYTLNILLAHLIWRKGEHTARFCTVFSNAGFIGIPLVTGVLGIEAVFYLAPFVVCFYLFVWTAGVFIMSGDRKEVSFRKIITNPAVWAVVIGIGVFLLPQKPPAPVMEAVSTLGGLNTPLAMLILGAYLARTDLLDMFRNKKVYLISLCRLVVLPGVLLPVLMLLPEEYSRIGMIVLIAAASPVGALAPVFAQMYGRDTGEGAQTVCLSTILCGVTMPLLLMLAQWLGIL